LQGLSSAPDPKSAPVKQRIEALTMPKGALDKLLQPYARIMAVHEGWRSRAPMRLASLVFAADHSLVCHAPVSAYPQSVTRQMLVNFLKGGAAHAVLAAQRCLSFTVVDLGVARPSEASTSGSLGEMIPKQRQGAGSTTNPQLNVFFVDAHVPTKLGMAMEFRNGCRDPRTEDSLGHTVAEAAYWAGHDAALAVIQRDMPQVLVLGEMGIGNTTPSAAIAEILLGHEGLAGEGTGVHGPNLEVKREAVARIRQRFKARSGNVASDPVRSAAALFASVGGFEHAGLAGAAVAAASRGVFVLLDGLIVTAAVAPLIEAYPNLRTWLLAGHQGREPAHGLLLSRYALEPLLHLDLALGEGSGALLAAGLLCDAHALVTGMATFAEAQVSTSDV
jgi:nicotinate-nucleotide--dimethylbenzimidazole phosphoribosyltransferase